MDFTTFVLQLMAGAIGGNVGPRLVRDRNPGPLFNSTLGALGGAVGGQLMEVLFQGGIPAGYLGSAGVAGIIGGCMPLAVAMVRRPGIPA